ncbi:Gfo/Idh/MocA family protein [Alteribacillus sp. HJP-4]|uniref:Gfo/Idh/MocA family protein n=1 Tax=Alteribacillus sp. HJP-4 TaxID=2775394 RepID=UPI0035CCD891
MTKRNVMWMKKMRAIQVGTGGFGQSWLHILMQSNDIELVAIVDIDEKNIRDAKNLLGDHFIPDYRDHIRAFSEVEADIAVIITPPQTHKALALAALEAGLYVFMEKPITQNFHEAIELYNESLPYHPFIMISQNYRWRPEIETVREVVQRGDAGDIEYGEWNFRRATKFGGWRDKYSEILVEDMSIHHFDLLRHILNKDATSIYARSKRPSWSWFEGNAVAGALINFGEDTLINYFGSWVTRGKETSWNGDFRLVGSHGIIELIDDIPYLTVEGKQRKELPLVSLPYTDRAYSIYEMVQAIREKRKPVTHIEDNLKSFEIVGGALRSIKESKEITLTQSN